jgi:hypothetical protein
MAFFVNSLSVTELRLAAPFGLMRKFLNIGINNKCQNEKVVINQPNLTFYGRTGTGSIIGLSNIL